MKEVDPEVDALVRGKFEQLDDLPAYDGQPQVFRYARPDVAGRPRAVTRLFTSDLMSGIIQDIKKGGETTLHSHSGMDGFWMVLSGRARFYGEGSVMGEFGPLEGVYIPREVKYWFESASDEPLQLLQIEAFVHGKPNRYRTFGATKKSTGLTPIFDARRDEPSP